MLTGLKTVTASENRAGGIAGSVTTANVTGLLNNCCFNFSKLSNVRSGLMKS